MTEEPPIGTVIRDGWGVMWKRTTPNGWVTESGVDDGWQDDAPGISWNDLVLEFGFERVI